MAKTSKTVETPAVGASVSTIVHYGDREINISDLPNHAIHYLLQYGLNKTRQDSVAGMAKRMAGEGKEQADIDAAVATSQSERLEAILNGTLGTRGGTQPKVTTIEKMVRKVATEWIKAAAAKAGKKLPKNVEVDGVNAYETLLEKYTEAKRADITAEAQRRLDISGEDADEGLLGDLV